MKDTHKHCLAIMLGAISLNLGAVTPVFASPIGLPDPDIFLVLLLFLAPVAVLTLIASALRRPANSTAGPNAIVAFAILYVLLLTIAYLDAINYGGWKQKLTALALLAVIAILIAFVLRMSRMVSLVIPSILATVLVLALCTGSIVDYRYITIDATDPLVNSNDVVNSLRADYLELSDGRVLRLDNPTKMYIQDGASAVIVPLGDDRFDITVSSREYIGDLNSRALVQIPLNEIVRSTHRARELGVGMWVGEQGGKDVRLHLLAGDDTCPAKEVQTLLDGGAKPNAILGHRSYPTAIYKAIFNRCGEIIAMLIRAGADLSISNDKQETPLTVATKYYQAYRPRQTDAVIIEMLQHAVPPAIHLRN